MKKTIVVIIILALLAVLVACRKTSTTAANKTNAPLALEAELLVGTFKLENSDLAVSAAQAKTLLPLWQTLQSLANSNTAATEEVNAVVDQIKGSMTAQQMAKITSMKLSGQDMISIMSQAGVSPNGASATTTPMALNGLPSGGGAPGGGPGGAGGPPAGGPQPGGNDFAGGGPGNPGGQAGASSTPQAGRMPGMGNQVPPPLLDALIQLLQKKIK